VVVEKFYQDNGVKFEQPDSVLNICLVFSFP
jgi:hypothetical protein